MCNAPFYVQIPFATNLTLPSMHTICHQHWAKKCGVSCSGKGKVTVLSPHPGSELCFADFDKYLPLSLGLHTPYPFGYPSQLPGEYTAAHTQLGATAYKSALTGTPLCSWVERSNAAWSALLRGTTSRRIGRVSNSGLDLDPNPESCTLPLDQLAAGMPSR